jgi:hypothetical protein
MQGLRPAAAGETLPGEKNDPIKLTKSYQQLFGVVSYIHSVILG